jgi:hypothetical protein
VKEILYKKEYIKYDNIKYKDCSPIDYITKTNEYRFRAKYLLPTKKHPLFLLESNDLTEKNFTENFNNPIWSVSRQNFLVVVEKDGDKIALKTFETFKYRKPGVKWFKVTKHMNFITVNIITGDIYVGGIKNYQLKRKCKKTIRRNYFINEPVLRMMSKIKNHIKSYGYNTENSATTAVEAVSTFVSQIDNEDVFGDLDFNERLFKFYLTKRGVKFPNNFSAFTNEWFGSDIKKCLKKKDNKMVDAVMMRHNISGKQVKKALHNCTKLNMEVYKFAQNVFGDDWLNQNYNLILECFNSDISTIPVPIEFYNYISNEELKRVFILFKQVVVTKTLDYYTFRDHIRMYVQLKRYGELDLKWMSSDESKVKFREEHLDWTDKIEYHRNGTYTRIYPKYSYDVIENPIKVGEYDYYPVLLDDSLNYNLESHLQSNCVKTYIDKCGSIIVSLRKGNDTSDDRATIEYVLNKSVGTDKISIERFQSLGRFNNRLSEEWNDVLFKLDKVMLSYVKDSRFETVKIIKKTNGKEFTSDSTWEEFGSEIPRTLIWCEDNIMKNEMNFN